MNIGKCVCFEEHLRTAASEETLGCDCLGLSFCRVAFCNIKKIPVAFKADQTNPYALF